MTRLALIGLCAAVIVVVGVLTMIRTRRLQERHALIWLIGAIVLGTLAASEALLGWIADLLTIRYPPSALFLIVVAFLGVALIDCVITISRLTDRNRTLAQRLAIVEERVAQIEAREAEGRTTESRAEGTT